MKKKKEVRQRNFVQAHVLDVCSPQVFTDRKKAFKKGYVKHKGRIDLSKAADAYQAAFLFAA